MYTDPAAIKAYSEFSGIAEDVAVQVREEFFPKKALALTSLSGVDDATKDAVEMKFMREPLTKSQLDEFFASYAK
ncbi:MAG: sulfonate transporter [Hyphomicrobiales bacterium]|nr:sulfonate transporter [Hyphomicrobiales bacterium]